MEGATRRNCMKILIVYATYSNSTFTAAHLAEQELKDANFEPQVILAREVQPEHIQNADLVIIASPSWDYHGNQGQPHEDYLLFRKAMEGKTFPGKKFAVLGLGDSTYTYFCGAVAHLEEMIAQLQGKLLVDSLKIDQFYMYEPESTQKIKEWTRRVAKQIQ
jgi:flavodoxin I